MLNILVNLNDFALSKCNDLGWLGYFIGKSKQDFQLSIRGSTDEKGEDQRIINALFDGITRNRSIREVSLTHLSNEGFAAIARILDNMTHQLEGLHVGGCVDNDNTLETLLESGIKLKYLSLTSWVAAS